MATKKTTKKPVKMNDAVRKLINEGAKKIIADVTRLRHENAELKKRGGVDMMMFARVRAQLRKYRDAIHTKEDLRNEHKNTCALLDETREVVVKLGDAYVNPQIFPNGHPK